MSNSYTPMAYDMDMPKPLPTPGPSTFAPVPLDGETVDYDDVMEEIAAIDRKLDELRADARAYAERLGLRVEELGAA